MPRILPLLLLLVLTSLTAVSQIVNFKTHHYFQAVPYPVGAGHPTDMAQADFNNDGHPDLATTNADDDGIQVMLNNGKAEFLTATRYATGGQPTSIAAGDVVGDQNIDLVVTSTKDDVIMILEGIGDGTFHLQDVRHAGISPIDLSLADYNGDGKTDIMARNDGSSLPLFLRSATDFDLVVTAQGLLADMMATGDLNGDGALDVIVGDDNSSFTSLYLLLNRGDGHFDMPLYLTDLMYYLKISAFRISDFTSDGILDIGFTTNDGYFEVWANDGNANFTSKKRYWQGLTNATRMVTGDFTGDGEQDVAFGSLSSSAISVLVASKEGGYQEAVSFPYKGYLQDMTAGNLDGDNKDDIALCGWPYHYLSILTSLPRFDIVAHDTSRFYGYPDPLFRSTVSGWPGPGELNITYQNDATPRSGIGTYAFTPVVSDSIRENFAVVLTPAILEVTPAPLTITAVDTARFQGRDNPVFRASVAGIKNGDVYPFSLYTEATIDSPPGTYTINAIGDQGGDPNYDATFVNGTLFVLSASSSPPYPNPTQGEFVIYSLETMPYKILASNGMEIQSGTMNEGYNTLHFTAAPGIYMIMTGHSGGHKLVKY